MTWRPYLKTASTFAAEDGGDSGLVLFKYALRVLRVLLLLAVWRAVYAGHDVVAGLRLTDVLTYTLIAEVFQAQLDARTRMDWTLHEGTVVMHLLRPVDTFGDYGAMMLGSWWWDLVRFSLPLMLIAPLVGVDPLPADALAAVLFVVSLGLGIAIGMAIDMLFGCLAVTMNASGGVWVIRYMRSGITTLLSGAFIPLALMPFGVGRVFGWLPFASMASAPLRIYIGQGAPLPLLAGQLAWAAGLWLALHAAWRVSVPRMVSVGG